MHPTVSPSRGLTRPLAGVALVLALSACGDDAPADPTGPMGPETGSLAVATSTTGSSLDPDGYTVVIDGAVGLKIGINARASLAELDHGEHDIELRGVALNCVVIGSNPRIIAVTGGAVAETSFSVGCSSPLLGSLEVTSVTTTTGSALDLDPDGYGVLIDAKPRGSVGANGTATFDRIGAGEHEIELTGVAPNCTVSDWDSQTITVEPNATAPVRFTVECEPVARSIAFTRNGDVFVMAADGSSERFIGPRNVTGPAWSPDGSQIVVGPELWCWSACDIGVVNADSGGLTRLTQTENNDGPAWSPDGARIAFTSWRDGNDEVYVMNADGSNQVRLTDEPGGDLSAAWSPDGSRIAFSTNRDGDWEIYVMNVDGSVPVRLTHEPDDDGDPAWSPDGSRIAFWGRRNGNYDIYVMQADGTNIARMTHGGSIDWEPAWSPDGSKISFTSDGDIHVMNADGSGRTNLTDDPAFELHSDWRP